MTDTHSGATKTYAGGCHCGAVRFEVELAIEKLMACNCSICSKRGHLLAFALEAKFRLLKGDPALSDYQFGKKSIHHTFCATCGVGAFGHGELNGMPMRAINARCLDGVDVSAYPVETFDGASL